jgi:hypothetical protein
VHAAVALCLASGEELRLLTASTHRSADRTIKRLDETIAYVGRLLKRKRNGK